MVIDKIRGMFSGSGDKGFCGELWIGGNVFMRECKVSVAPYCVLFTSKDEKMELLPGGIFLLEHADRVLSFSYKHRKYLFTAEKDVSMLYESMRPLVRPCSTLCEKDVKFSVYNTAVGKFETVCEKSKVSIVESGVFFIKVSSAGRDPDFEEITSQIQYFMDNANMTFVWSIHDGGVFHTSSLKFSSNGDFLEFLSKYVTCLWRNLNPEADLKDKKTKEAEEYFERMEVENYVCGDESEEEPIDEKEEEYESCDDDELENHFGEADDKNKHLVVGKDIAFVTRGKSVGVFKNKDNGLEFKTNIKDVLEGDVKKVIAHGGYESLIYLDKNEMDKLHKIDVERGEVVETWDIDRNVNDYFDSQKLVDTGTFVGVSDYSVFRIDPRAKKKVVECKDYKTKKEFSCGTTTGDGYVAIAGKKGDLRLYNEIGKRAKSLLPGFGDEIKHIDVTSNGEHIICTCKNYLMLTTVPRDYSQAIGKAKPVPKRLQLKPEHLVYINEEVNFTPARFSTDQTEDSIITSTGSYVVRWNLKDVLGGKLYSYRLARCNDLVIADNFEIGENDSIVVTMPDDVRKVSVENLKAPGRRAWGI